jgi:hypothetical protein
LALPEVSVTVIVGVGSGFTVIVVDVVDEQPLPSVTVTVYEVVAVGDLVIAAVSSPELQVYEVPPEAVSEALAPLQIVPSSFVVPDVSVTTIDGIGSGFTVIVVAVVVSQPSEFVTVTVYVVVVAGDSVIAAVASPVSHAYEVPPDAVITTLAPSQIVPSLLVTPDVSAIVTDGVGSAFTVIIVEVAEVHPSELVTVTV